MRWNVKSSMPRREVEEKQEGRTEGRKEGGGEGGMASRRQPKGRLAPTPTIPLPFAFRHFEAETPSLGLNRTYGATDGLVTSSDLEPTG